MSALTATYDAWRLQGPPEHDEIGMHHGDTCNRVHEPNDDAPRNYRPKPCTGEMTHSDGVTICDTCREIAE